MHLISMGPSVTEEWNSDPFDSTLQVSLRLLQGSEDCSGIHDILSTSDIPIDWMRFAIWNIEMEFLLMLSCWFSALAVSLNLPRWNHTRMYRLFILDWWRGKLKGIISPLLEVKQPTCQCDQICYLSISSSCLRSEAGCYSSRGSFYWKRRSRNLL